MFNKTPLITLAALLGGLSLIGLIDIIISIVNFMNGAKFDWAYYIIFIAFIIGASIGSLFMWLLFRKIEKDIFKKLGLGK